MIASMRPDARATCSETGGRSPTVRKVPLLPRLLAALLLTILAAAPVAAENEDVWLPGPARTAFSVRYLEDSFVLRLNPAAARAVPVVSTRPTVAGPGPVGPLGLASLDRVAADLGGATFEAEFPGESAPAPGSGATDLTTFYIVHLPPGVGREAALRRFRLLSEVASVWPIGVTALAGVSASPVPDDSLWSEAFNLYQPSRHDIHALEAWSVTTGDSSVVVAILDSGIIPYHPDLGGTTAGLSGNLWVNRAEKGGRPGVDDDGNGYVDDVAGWDFVNFSSPALADGDSIKTGEDWRDADNDPNDFSGHGTPVAGIVAALTNNRIGISGTAPTVRMMPLRVAWSTRDHPLGDVSMTYAAQAIRYATRTGASVLNCSFSTEGQPDFDAAVGEAIRAGVTIVLAAGNNGISNWLALRPDIIAVGATDRDDLVAAFSNRGPELDLCAPGERVPSTTLTRPGADSVGMRQSRYLVGVSGTSFAAPQVAAAAALVQSHRRDLGQPPLKQLEMLFRLRDTADDISALNPAGGYGSGRLNLYRALTDPPGSYAVRAGAATVGPAVALPTTSGHIRMAFAMSDAHLLFLDGVKGDTLRVVTLPGVPFGWLAAADLGGGRGTGLFLATADGRVVGLDVAGDPLPGWPVTAVGGVPTMTVGGPALGDLDGDGMLEIVVGTTDGAIWAWRADGTRMPGFPIRNVGVSQPVALTPIDADPGVEIVVVSAITLHAIRFDGREAAGWPPPIAVGPFTPPVVTATGPDHMPTVFATSLAATIGIGADGLGRQRFALSGAYDLEPAVGDLNGDGQDDLVLILPGRQQTVVLDPNTGVGFSGPWPTSAFDSALGPPILARADHGAAPDIIAFTRAGLIGITAQAAALPRFPPPILAGMFPTAADPRGDGTAQVIAGSGPAPGGELDPLLLVVDAGSGTWDESLSPWPTQRGGFARTGSRLYSPPLALLDDTPPPPVTDLRADSASAFSLTLHWTTPVLPRGAGPASAYEVRWSAGLLSPENFALATPARGVAPPLVAGEARRLRVTGLAPQSHAALAVRVRDRVGSWSTISNVVEVTTGPIVPAPVADLRVVAATDTSIDLAWTATAAEDGLVRAARYEIRAATAPIDGASFDDAPLGWTRAAGAAPGAVERVSVGGLVRASDYWIAVRAVDAAGQRSAIATMAGTRTDVGGPLRDRPGVAIACRVQPARAPLELYWRGATGGAGSGGPQSVRLYDLQGRAVRELPLGAKGGGVAQWDGRDQDGRLVPAGIYFARLISGSVHAQARVVLLP